jgi:hypothetical protein
LVGGALQGTIRLSHIVRPPDGFKLKLSCINIVATRGSSNSSTSERILWTDEQQAGTGVGDTVPVAFYIPQDCRETYFDNADNIVLWRLQVTAKGPGVDYAAQFEVPVFKVAETPEQIAAGETVRSQEQAAIERYQQPLESRIHVETSVRGGKEFYFPAMRNPGVAIGMMVFFAVWSAVLWLTIHLKAPIIFPIAWSLFEIIILYIVLQSWSGTTRVVAEVDGLTITNKLLGIGRARTIPASDIVEIKTKIGMTSGQTGYQDIKVVCRNGREVTAGSTIKDTREAAWLAQQMMKSVRGR